MILYLKIAVVENRMIINYIIGTLVDEELLLLNVKMDVEMRSITRPIGVIAICISRLIGSIPLLYMLFAVI